MRGKATLISVDLKEHHCARRFLEERAPPTLVRLHHNLRDSFKDLLRTMDHLPRKNKHTNCVISGSTQIPD